MRRALAQEPSTGESSQSTVAPPALNAYVLESAPGILSRKDPTLRKVIRRVGPCSLSPGRQPDHLTALVRSIVFQQLSGKAASTIFTRLRNLVPGARRGPNAAQWLALKDEPLRAAGLSRQKISYLRDLCARVLSGELPIGSLEGMDDLEIMDRLTQVRGFGQWSAHMYLMFHLGRPDVWPTEDLGIRKALMRLDRLAELPRPRQILERADLWRPYRTVASWYLWRLLDVSMDEVGW